MGKKQTVGLAGSAILFIGVFTPMVSLPFVGNLNYFRNGTGDGVIVMLLAVLSAFLVLTKRYRGLWATASGCVATLVLTFVHFVSMMNEMQASLDNKQSGNMFHGLADMAFQSVQLQWGWALLIAGTVLLFAAAAIKEDSDNGAACPYCANWLTPLEDVCGACGNALRWFHGRALRFPLQVSAHATERVAMTPIRPAKKSFYEILGVSETASAESIRASYDHAIRKYSELSEHGDHNASNQLKFAKAAFEVLSNSAQRRLYDARLSKTAGSQPHAVFTSADESNAVSVYENPPSRELSISDGIASLLKNRAVAFLMGGILIAILFAYLMNPSSNEVSKRNVTNDNIMPSKPEPRTIQGWEYSSSEDKMRNQTTRFALLESANVLQFDFPYSGGSRGIIQLQKQDGEATFAILRITKGQFVCHSSCELAVKFDDRELEKIGASPSASGRLDRIVIDNEAFIDNLKTSRFVVIEPQFHQYGRKQLEFNIDGLKWE